MLFKDDGTLVLHSGYLYRFDAVPTMLYTEATQATKPYVPSSNEAQVALAEYRSWTTQFAQPLNSGLISLLSDVEVQRQVLLTQLDLEASAFESNLNKSMYFTSSLGFKVNGDRRTKGNLSDLIMYFDLQAASGYIDYRDYDNITRKLNKEQLTTLLTELVINGQALYQQKWVLQDQINKAASLDDLHAVNIEFKMMDFSKGAV